MGPEYDYDSYPNKEYKRALVFKDGVILTHYKYYEGGFDSPGTGGELQSEIPLKHGLAEGTAKFYYQKFFKKVQTITPYRSGVKNGIEQNFYPNGSLSAEIPFKDGEKEGTEKQYPRRIFPFPALTALVRGGPGQPKKELHFLGGMQAGLTEAELSLNEPFEDDDYSEEEDDD